MAFRRARRLDDRRRGTVKPHVGEFDAGWASGKAASQKVQALVPGRPTAVPHGPRAMKQPE